MFRRWEWLSVWWKWFGKNRELHLLSLTRGRELVGILPLYVSRTRFGGRKLSWIGVGGPTCPEYLGPIIHRDYGEAAVERSPAISDRPHGVGTAYGFPTFRRTIWSPRL